jgi:hypothetical protein
MKLTHYICTFMCLLQVGSSPGFEDGDFESAKLRRPAGSYYHAIKNCLYFLDSEVCICIYTIIIFSFLANLVTFDGDFMYTLI